MQDHPPVGEFGRAGIIDPVGGNGEIAGAGGAEKGRDLRFRRGRLVGAAALPRREAQRDAPAPRERRLAGIAGVIRVRQRVALDLVHQDEGVEGHRLARARERRDGLLDRLIGGRAAIDGPTRHLRHLGGRRASDPRDRPGHGLGVIGGLLDLGHDPGRAAAQIVAEPRDHQRDRAAIGKLAVEHLERGGKVALARGRVHVRSTHHPGRAVDIDRGRGERIFARSGDQRHRPGAARHFCRRVGLLRADHLEIEQRDAVAEAGHVEILEHHIGDAAIGGRLAGAVHRLDLGVGQLGLAAGIDAHVEVIGRDLHPVGPDAPDPGDLAFAERNGERHLVGKLGRRRPRRQPLAAAALAADLLEMRGPDHLPRKPHPPVDLCHRRALACAHEAKAVHPAMLHGLCARAQQALVDRAPQRRPHRAADQHRGKPQHAAADRAANGGTCRCQYDCRHQNSLSGKAKHATILRAQGAESALSSTPCPL